MKFSEWLKHKIIVFLFPEEMKEHNIMVVFLTFLKKELCQIISMKVWELL